MTFYLMLFCVVFCVGFVFGAGGIMLGMYIEQTNQERDAQ